MRATLWVLAVVLAAGFLGLADDGSVPWPTIGKSENIQSFPLDVLVCAVICGLGGCDFNGRLLGCTCSGGQVCCMYYRCLQNPPWMIWYPCYCGTETECYGIPCEPGQPIPMRMPVAVPLD